VIYQHLFERVQEPTTVRAGMIGAGHFGTPIVTQSPIIPRLEVPVVADVDVEAGRRAYLQAGYDEDDITVCGSHAAALRAMESGKRVVLRDALLMMDLPLDVIATATRVPEAGARFAWEAIQHGKHVVMIDKEADSVVGPILKYLADRAGLVFTTDDGDQPGLLMGLVSWAQALGMEVLCGGNLHGCLYEPKAGTLTNRARITVRVPEDERWVLERVVPGEAGRYASARRRLVADWRPSQERGDPICHMAVAANGTGLLPDAPAGHRPVVRLIELPEVLCPVEEGGILEARGAIDVPVVMHSPDEPSVDGGVYVVVANDDACSRAVMIQKGLVANSRKTAMLVYRPHHLCGAETAMSILCAGLLGVPTGSACVLPRVDMIGTADRDLGAGEVLGVDGGLGYSPDLRASMVTAFPLAAGAPVPYFMLEGNRLAMDVPRGAAITLDMIERPADSALWALRAQQDAQFLGG
jgi:predicted homoserine dehydrogenase-like protein